MEPLTTVMSTAEAVSVGFAACVQAHYFGGGDAAAPSTSRSTSSAPRSRTSPRTSSGCGTTSSTRCAGAAGSAWKDLYARRAALLGVIRCVRGPPSLQPGRGAARARADAATSGPTAVLIEGPSDFNDRIGELALDHRLPIAIYCVGRAGRRAARGAYHPFCVHSPEWQALRAGFEIGADVRFIDLPWAAIAGRREAEHRYGDDELRRSRAMSGAVRAARRRGLRRRLGRAGRDRPGAGPGRVPAPRRSCCAPSCARQACREARPRARGVHGRADPRPRTSTGHVLVVCGGFHVDGPDEAPAARRSRLAEAPARASDGWSRCTPVLVRGARRADGLRGRDAQPGLLRPRLARRGPSGAAPARAAAGAVVARCASAASTSRPRT